jgi:hypothetical protein
LGSSKRDAADIGKNIVDDDEAGGQQEPNHALKDIVDNEMGLDDNEIQCNMCPSKLCELEPIVTFLKGSNEENKALVVRKVCKGSLLTENVQHKADESVVCRKR